MRGLNADEVKNVLGYSLKELRSVLKKLKSENLNYNEQFEWFLINSPIKNNVTKMTIHTLIDNYEWYNKIEFGNYKRNCDYCGKTFFTNAPRSLYCSSYCGTKQRDINSKLRIKNTHFIEKTCMFCNEHFKTNIHTEEYCSCNCKIKMLNLKNKTRIEADDKLYRYVLETIKLLDEEKNILLNIEKIKKTLANKNKGKKTKPVKIKKPIESKIKTKPIVTSKPYIVDENKLLKDLLKLGRGASKTCPYEHRHRDVFEESLKTDYKGKDSLFCDTEFLESFFGKKIKKTEKCN